MMVRTDIMAPSLRELSSKARLKEDEAQVIVHPSGMVVKFFFL